MHNTNCNEQVKKRITKSDEGIQHKTGWNLLAVKWPAKFINAPSELRRYTVIAQECNVNLKQLKNSNSEKKHGFGKMSWSETTLWWKIKNRSIFDMLSVLTHARNVLSWRLRKAPLSPCSVRTLYSQNPRHFTGAASTCTSWESNISLTDNSG